jgi:transcriptional regulator with XRE-family HTH domain
MSKLKPRELAAEAHRRNLEQLARLGAEVRGARLRRRLTQTKVAELVGLAQSTISDLERGYGGSLSMDSWQRVSLALGRPMRIDLTRDFEEDPVDAGHLAMQELVLRTARGAGYVRRFELSTRPSDPSRSADVGLVNPRAALLVLVECVNTIGNVGEAARSSERKRAEAEQLAATYGDGRPFRVGVCWVIRAVERNRALVGRYPELFATRFPGSSLAWLRALTLGTEPPSEPGIVWSDIRATRLYALRLPALPRTPEPVPSPLLSHRGPGAPRPHRR